MYGELLETDKQEWTNATLFAEPLATSTFIPVDKPPSLLLEVETKTNKPVAKPLVKERDVTCGSETIRWDAASSKLKSKVVRVELECKAVGSNNVTPSPTNKKGRHHSDNWSPSPRKTLKLNKKTKTKKKKSSKVCG